MLVWPPNRKTMLPIGMLPLPRRHGNPAIELEGGPNFLAIRAVPAF